MNCPKYQAEIEWMEQPQPIGERRTLREGDNFICAECSAVCIVENAGLREMTAREFLSKAKASRDVIKDLYTKALKAKLSKA
jgi:hypothetical protein